MTHRIKFAVTLLLFFFVPVICAYFIRLGFSTVYVYFAGSVLAVIITTYLSWLAMTSPVNPYEDDGG